MPRKKVDPTAPVPTGSFIREASNKELLDRIEKLEKDRRELLNTKEANEKQIEALKVAQQQGALYAANVIEVPTGETKTVRTFNKYKKVGTRDNGAPIVQPTFEDVEVPTYYYKIDMPPCGDTCLKINGQEFYHGAVYEFDMDTLRTVKDIVARTWAHDKAIHPNDENFYRRQDQSWQQRNQRAINKGVLNG